MLYVFPAQRWCHDLRRGIRRPVRLDSLLRPALARQRPVLSGRMWLHPYLADELHLGMDRHTGYRPRPSMLRAGVHVAASKHLTNDRCFERRPMISLRSTAACPKLVLTRDIHA